MVDPIPMVDFILRVDPIPIVDPIPTVDPVPMVGPIPTVDPNPMTASPIMHRTIAFDAGPYSHKLLFK